MIRSEPSLLIKNKLVNACLMGALTRLTLKAPGPLFKACYSKPGARAIGQGLLQQVRRKSHWSRLATASQAREPLFKACYSKPGARAIGQGLLQQVRCKSYWSRLATASQTREPLVKACYIKSDARDIGQGLLQQVRRQGEVQNGVRSK